MVPTLTMILQPDEIQRDTVRLFRLNSFVKDTGRKEDVDAEPERQQWDNPMEFLLSCISMSVGNLTNFFKRLKRKLCIWFFCFNYKAFFNTSSNSFVHILVSNDGSIHGQIRQDWQFSNWDTTSRNTLLFFVLCAF